MLVNIQRQNQEEEFVHEREAKKRKNSCDKTRAAKRFKTNQYDDPSEDLSESDVNEDEKEGVDSSDISFTKESREDGTEPSVLESPEFTSTHRDASAPTHSIFKYSGENSDVDDSIFDISDL